MKIEIGVQDIRGLLQVGEAIDEKGNAVMALEILGQPVLYADPDRLPFGDAEDWEGIFGRRLAGILADLLLRGDDPQGWQRDSPTGREIHRLSPRED